MIHTEKQTAEMTLSSLVKDYAAYNLWANKTLIEWLKSKPAELMGREVASSFPSIKETIYHIADTQKWWLGTLKQTPVELLWGQKYTGSAEEAFNYLLEQSEELAAFAETLSEDALREERSFTIPTVGDFVMPVFEIAQHVSNHSTYHRGQVITIGRNVGLTDAPMTDYMFYLLMGNFAS